MADVAPLIFEYVVPLGDDCHCIVPVFPASVSVAVLPVQMDGAEAVAVPPTEAATIVI